MFDVLDMIFCIDVLDTAIIALHRDTFMKNMFLG